MEDQFLSPVQGRLWDTFEQVKDDPADVDCTFTPRELIQCTLPHSDPGDTPRWIRKNGHYALVIQPGWDAFKDECIGYPYGTIPRLLMHWITTQCKRQQDSENPRRLELGNSLTKFMREVGLNPDNGSGKRSDARRLCDQMNRLFTARISFQYQKEMESTFYQSRLDMQVAPKSELWWSDRKPDQPVFGSWIELSQEFYDAITGYSVPVDMRALKALKNSSLAIDLYAWCAYTNFKLLKSDHDKKFVPWRALVKQLGCEYGDIKDFKKKAKATLKKIKLVYPFLDVKYVNGGVSFNRSWPPVPIKNYDPSRILQFPIPEEYR